MLFKIKYLDNFEASNLLTEYSNSLSFYRDYIVFFSHVQLNKIIIGDFLDSN